MRTMATVAGEEFRAAFNLGNWTDNGGNGLGLDCWGPVLNLNRDPRVRLIRHLELIEFI